MNPLHKMQLSSGEASLQRRGRFFAADTDAELQALVEEDPTLLAAKSALEELSRDPEARRIARQRVLVLERQRREREGYRLKGMLKAKHQDILSVLTARCFSVPEDVQARLLAERDHAVLERWLVRAVTATTLDDVFRE
jgi:hypothetical protein